MGFKEWIIPQDRAFYDLLDRYADTLDKGVTELGRLIETWDDWEAGRKGLKEIEHEGDRIGHEIFDRLGKTFITPFDREDITELARSLDDVIDFIHATGNRIALFEIPATTEALSGFYAILKQQVAQLVPAVKMLRKSGKRPEVAGHVIEVHRLENEADRLLNRSIAELYKTNDAIQILKYKDIYENLESATDQCEDVADVLNDIVRKHG